MTLTEQDIEFIKANMAGWLAEQSLVKPTAVYEIELRERMVRVEEELRHQRELMREGFAQMEKRFEQVDKHFEKVDRRFELDAVEYGQAFRAGRQTFRKRASGYSRTAAAHGSLHDLVIRYHRGRGRRCRQCAEILESLKRIGRGGSPRVIRLAAPAKRHRPGAGALDHLPAHGHGLGPDRRPSAPRAR